MLKNDIFNCPIVVFEKLELERYNQILWVIFTHVTSYFPPIINKFPTKLLTSSRAVIKLKGATLNHLKLPLQVENFHFLKRFIKQFYSRKILQATAGQDKVVVSNYI